MSGLQSARDLRDRVCESASPVERLPILAAKVSKDCPERCFPGWHMQGLCQVCSSLHTKFGNEIFEPAGPG
jgi:hypothetical protein